MMKKILCLAVSWAVAVPSLVSLAYAQDLKDQTSDEPSSECERKCRNRPSADRWSFLAGIRYYGLNSLDSLNTLYQDNGLPQFNDHSAGLGFTFYYRAANLWQIGFALESLAESQEQGVSVAEYSATRLGVWLAKDLLRHPTWDFTLGSQIGFGDTELLLLSNSQDGRIEESFIYAEPTLMVSYRVSSGVKAGVGASYLIPLSLSTTAKGDNLGIDSILPKAWTAQFQLIFGKE